MNRYEITINPVPGIIKSPAIWETEGSGTRPMMYLRKPKSVNDKEFYEFVCSLEIAIRR